MSMNTEQPSTGQSDVVRIERRGPVAVLRIDRPEARNALNAAVFDGLSTHLRELRLDDSVRAVVLSGANGVFCAGADITSFDALRADPLLGERRASGGTLWADLESFPKPVIAAVEGLALGGGLELVLACDTSIVGSGARLGLPEVKLGVIPGGGGTQRLIRAIGKPRAMALLLSGDLITGAEAADLGLVGTVVDDRAGTDKNNDNDNDDDNSGVLEQAVALAERISGNSPLAVALAKDAALAAQAGSMAAGLEHEKRNFAIALASEDSHEGQAAFLAKRSPNFTGR